MNFIWAMIRLYGHLQGRYMDMGLSNFNTRASEKPFLIFIFIDSENLVNTRKDVERVEQYTLPILVKEAVYM